MIPALAYPTLPAMTDEQIDLVRAVEAKMLEMPQISIPTHHLLHGGMYARTITLHTGMAISGAQIEVATILIVNGKCSVFAGDDTIEIDGHAVIPGSKGRKQLFLAETETSLTVVFPTQAKTIEDAEEEFTKEAARLGSRQCAEHDTHIITGE